MSAQGVQRDYRVLQIILELDRHLEQPEYFTNYHGEHTRARMDPHEESSNDRSVDQLDSNH